MINPNPKCVICGKDATTTAAQILVCDGHYKEYADEAKKYLPECKRDFYNKLLNL